MVLAGGCTALAPRYAYVDSVASRAASGMTRYVLLAQPRGYARGQDLPGYVRHRHERFVEQAHALLQAAGYQPVSSADAAQLVIALDYGVEIVRGPVRTERTSSVQLVAFDWHAVRDDDERNAIWRTHAYMAGSSGGLGRVVPDLLNALAPYVGTNTEGAVEITLD